MAEEVCLHIDGLSLSIQKKRILHDISLTVQAGECIGIIGPNGSGKSSLLQAILGFLPSQGTMTFLGRNMQTFSPRERAQNIAYVAQHGTGSLSFTVESFLHLAYFPWQKSLKFSDWLADFQRLCKEFDLLDKLERDVMTLSGGERQRVALVQSLLQKPQLLLLDEITNHLDIAYQWETLRYVGRQAMTKIMVLHDLNHAAQFCDRLVLLKNGTCFRSGLTAEVLNEATIRDLFGMSCEIIRESGRIRHIMIGSRDWRNA